MNDHHSARKIVEPLRIVSGIGINSAEAPGLNADDAAALDSLCRRWTVCLTLDQAAFNRLYSLWNTVLQVGADEIGDWSLQSLCEVIAADGSKPPCVLGVAATVYANGEVACAVTLDGIDAALDFAEVFDLTDLEASAMGSSSKVVPV